MTDLTQAIFEKESCGDLLGGAHLFLRKPHTTYIFLSLIKMLFTLSRKTRPGLDKCHSAYGAASCSVCMVALFFNKLFSL